MVNADQIIGGTITGIKFMTDVEGKPRIEFTGTGLRTYDNNDSLHGPYIDPVTGGFIINYSDIAHFPGTAEVFEIAPSWDTAANDVKCQIKHQAQTFLELIGSYIKPKGNWDFGSATIINLSGYVGSVQNLSLQVNNGKLEIRDSGTLIGTITLD